MENKVEGLRYNEGKLRYDLIHPQGIKGLAQVLTKGAEKYSPKNWEKGMKWTTVIASLKRHLAAIEAGEDYDKESGLLHADHLQCNAHFLSSYYKIAPQYDDRNHSYLNMKRIGLDIDETIAGFLKAYSDRTGKTENPLHWQYCKDIKNNFTEWEKDGTLNSLYLEEIKPIVNSHLPFIVDCYITNRPVSNNITEQWLDKHNFPLSDCFTVKNRNDKVKIAKERNLDIFLDDNYETFVEMNKNGILCFLINNKHNEQFDVGFKRVMSIDDFVNRFIN